MHPEVLTKAKGEESGVDAATDNVETFEFSADIAELMSLIINGE